MKKKLSVVLLMLSFLLILGGCSPVSSNYIKEVEKVMAWQGVEAKTEGKVKIEYDGEKMEVPIKVQALSKGQDKAYIKMDMDLGSVGKFASKSEDKLPLDLPKTIAMEMYVIDGQVYIGKEYFNTLAKSFKSKSEIKEDFVKLPIDYKLSGPQQEAAMQYVQSTQYQKDFLNVLKVALKDFKPTNEIKMSDGKYVYEADGEAILKDFTAAIATTVKNWNETSKALKPILKGMDIKVSDKELEDAVKGFDLEKMTQSFGDAKELIKPLKIKAESEFKENEYEEKLEVKYKNEKFGLELEMESESKKSNKDIKAPTSVKALTEEELKSIFKTSNFFVSVNDKMLDFDVEPIIENGRTLVPFRTLFESLGAEVNWDQENKIASCKKDDKEIKIFIGQNKAEVNGKAIELDSLPKIKDGRTLVPLRFVSENLGYEVEFEKAGDAKFISIMDKEYAKKHKEEMAKLETQLKDSQKQTEKKN